MLRSSGTQPGALPRRGMDGHRKATAEGHGAAARVARGSGVVRVGHSATEGATPPRHAMAIATAEGHGAAARVARGRRCVLRVGHSATELRRRGVRWPSQGNRRRPRTSISGHTESSHGNGRRPWRRRWSLASALAAPPSAPPLRRVRVIELPGVEGRIDHLAVDVQARRLYVAALGNDTVEVIDLAAGRPASARSAASPSRRASWCGPTRNGSSSPADGRALCGCSTPGRSQP